MRALLDIWNTYDRDQVLGDDLIEAREQGLDLIFDRRIQPVARRQLHEFSFVLLCNRQLGTILLQVNDPGNTEL